jgi:hypothetical protein
VDAAVSKVASTGTGTLAPYMLDGVTDALDYDYEEVT